MLGWRTLRPGSSTRDSPPSGWATRPGERMSEGHACGLKVPRRPRGGAAHVGRPGVRPIDGAVAAPIVALQALRSHSRRSPGRCDACPVRTSGPFVSAGAASGSGATPTPRGAATAANAALRSKSPTSCRWVPRPSGVVGRHPRRPSVVRTYARVAARQDTYGVGGPARAMPSMVCLMKRRDWASGCLRSGAHQCAAHPVYGNWFGAKRWLRRRTINVGRLDAART